MIEPLHVKLWKNRDIASRADCNPWDKFLKIKGKALELGHMDSWHALRKS